MKEVCLSRRAFFSLNSNYIENVYDGFLFMISRGGWNYKDLYELPVSKRDWLLERYIEINKPKEEE